MYEPLTLASARWSISLGQDLRARLDAVAREEGADATYVARRIVREYVEQAERGADPNLPLAIGEER